MLNASQNFKDSIDSLSHDVKALVRVCWDKQEATSANWFRLDESQLDSGFLLTSDAYLQNESITQIIGNYDKFQYTNEDTYVISAEGFDEFNGDLNQAVSKEADIVLSNSDGRFTPKTDRNLLLNPGFDYLNLDYWTVSSGVGSYGLTNDVSSGTGALYMAKSGLGTMSVKSDPATVLPNYGYTGSIFAKGTGQFNLAVVSSGLSGDINSGLLAGQQLTSNYQRFETGLIMPSVQSGIQTAYLRADLTGTTQGSLTNSQFVEDFNTTTYEDTTSTNANWVTSSKKVILPRGTNYGSTQTYGTIDNNNYSIGSINFNYLDSVSSKLSFYFIAPSAKTISQIRLFSVKLGVPPTYRIGLQNDNGSGQADGSWLSYVDSSTFLYWSWDVFNIPDYVLVPGRKYHIVVQYLSGTINASNCVAIAIYYPSTSRTGSTLWTVSYPVSYNTAKPVFLLDFTDSTYWGQPYATTGSTYQTIHSSNSIGQAVTPIGGNWNVNKFEFAIHEAGFTASSFGNVSIRIIKDSDKSVVYDSGTVLSSSDITDTYLVKSVNINVTLISGSLYYVIIKNSGVGDGNNGYEISANDTTNAGSPYKEATFDSVTSYYIYTANETTFYSQTNGDLAFKVTYTINTEQYSTSANVVSLTADSTANPIHYATLIPKDTASGTAHVNYFLSNDAGSNWLPVSSGVQTNFTQLNSDLRWKATLNTDDQTITPEIKTVVINYSHGIAGVEMTLDNAKLEQGGVTDFDQTFIGDKILPKRPTKIYLDSDGKNIQKFTGVTENAVPDLLSDEISFHLLDFSKELEAKQATTAMYQNLPTSSGIQLLAGEMGMTSGTWVIDAGRHILPFMWFQEGSIWYYMQQLAEAEGGRVFFDEDGVLNFWNRDHFISSGTTSDTLEFDKLTNLAWRIDKDSIKNHIIVKSTPREVQPRQLVYTHGVSEEVRPGETVEVWARFVDVNRNSEGMPCMGVEQPIASSSTTSSYLANASSDGTGSNLTSDVIVSSWYGFAESARINFRNNGTQTAFITSLTIWAAPVKVTQDIYEEASDQTSIDLYGDQVLQIENNLINSKNIAKTIAYKKLEELKDPKTHLRGDISGKGYYQVGDLITVQDDFPDATTGSGTYQDLMVKSNRWQITDDLYQSMEFEKTTILPWFILDQSTLDSGYVLFI